MHQPPFSADEELCKGLVVLKLGQGNLIQRTSKSTGEGQTPSKQKNYLPGEPNIQLDDATIGTHLEEELVTADLDRLSAYLWLVAKQDSSHISSLTHQIVRGREIVITENPGLHLVWHYNRVFIKPLPKYLLSHAFWEFYLISPDSPILEPRRNELRKAGLGFLRSYHHLIRRRSDFDLAMREETRLLPKKTKYAHFVKLIKYLEAVEDNMVSSRYSYGELRLSRLNLWIKLILFRFTYHKAEGQYGPYFARFYGPIIFLFTIFSVILSAMQVVLAAISLVDGSGSRSWHSFVSASQGFSIFTLFAAAVALLLLLVVLVALSSREAVYALKDLYRKRQGRKTVTVESGVTTSPIGDRERGLDPIPRTQQLN
ncbi:putative subtilisin-like serine protease [Rosellinia necatrix]|uniref:Putative subtilisin-like serine protease n=1 Tax=Rosellinia necatrix TaxID=77044 RepID=A0A1W2TAS7_ROSNE|nr:putative subtilisin-like serine protease [Rosellinia necatrix]